MSTALTHVQGDNANKLSQAIFKMVRIYLHSTAMNTIVILSTKFYILKWKILSYSCLYNQYSISSATKQGLPLSRMTTNN